MEVKIKKLHPDAVIPKYAKEGDAGLDLVATSMKHDENGCIVYGTGLAFEIPEGYVGLVFPRSSVAKYTISLSNAVGVIDSGFRGEVTAKFRPMLRFEKGLTEDTKDKYPVIYQPGDRIAQMIIIPYPHIDFTEVSELSETERGAGGYGSTGK